MRVVYPVIFTKLDKGYMAFVPDMEINTQGDDLAEAIYMARDAIGLVGLDMQDDEKELPRPTSLEEVEHQPGEIVSLVDVDLTAYRKAHEQRTVRRNVSLPSWLNERADEAGINVSAVLQKALRQELSL